MLERLCNLYGDWQIRTIFQHQILRGTQQICYEDTRNISPGFWQTRFRSNTGIWVSCVFNIWSSVVQAYERTEGLKAPENVRKSRKLVHEERLRTIHLLSNMNRISYGVWWILLRGNLNMHRVAVNYVLPLLALNQKQWLLEFLELRETAPNFHFYYHHRQW